MPKRRPIPTALTIAGSDSGGGAGIQADLKTFAALGVHGTSAITCLTAQNPARILGLQPASPKFVALQLEAVFSGLRPDAVKTGMLHSQAVVRAVADFLKKNAGPNLRLVVDPVMVSTSGTQLLDAGAVSLLKRGLFPLAVLVTPNLAEAETILTMRIRSIGDMRSASHKFHREFGCAVLIKGGHLKGAKEAADVFFDGREELLLSCPFIKGVKTHGTGCTFSAAITAHLAHGCGLQDALRNAKGFITGAIAGGFLAKGRHVLDPFWSKRL